MASSLAWSSRSSRSATSSQGIESSPSSRMAARTFLMIAESGFPIRAAMSAWRSLRLTGFLSELSILRNFGISVRLFIGRGRFEYRKAELQLVDDAALEFGILPP